MKKIIKGTFCLFTILISLSGCQNIKDGLTGKKNTNSDEFLVQKKNPLTMPPKFEKLPVPKKLNDINKRAQTDNSIEKIFSKNSSITNTITTGEPSNGSLEKNILEKIKNN